MTVELGQERPDPEGRRIRLLLDAITDYAVFMLDTDGAVISWNAGAARAKGYSASEILGRHFSKFYSDEDRAAGLPALALATAEREGRFEAEGWRVRKDGSRIWAHDIMDPVRDETGTLIGFAAITRDVTERKKARDALREREECFRRLVHGVTDYAIYMLDPDGHVTNWNVGAERIKGYTETEIVGRHFSDFYTPEERAAGVPQRALDTAAREGCYSNEGWRVRKDGSRFFASVVIDPIRDESGRLLGFAKITRDISERKAAEEALEKARAEAHEAQKMAAIAQLSSGIAHDFNNLLTVVMGNLDMLKRAGDERRPRLIENALNAVEQARRLTGKLLAFSRRQTLFPEPVDLKTMIAGMDDMLAQSLRGDILLEMDLPDGIWPVEVDPTQLQIALINIAVNARDAMPKGGSFRIKIENTVLRNGQMQESVGISLTDTGVGIPPDTLSQVFEPFFTTKEVGKGTGLGLAQVYGFAQQSGGSVGIRSEVGRGTTITLYLPRGRPARVRPAQPEPASPRPTRPLHVLLVEDNADVAEVARSLLLEQGYEVTHMQTADEALRILEAGFVVDLVFSDLVMPGQYNGLDLARAVRERWPDLPVLLATGYSDAANQSTDEGFALITKPYQPPALIVAVQEATAGRRPVPTNVVQLPRGRKQARD
jgi:PAS domain S-box-containing protein